MSKTDLKICKDEQGFTLVELAIVMIIIGLLIGGILKGQELIGNAQLTSTVAQIKSVDAAVTTFRDQYNALPGDVANPGTRLQGCTGVPCNNVILATAGNGRIDSVADPTANPHNLGRLVDNADERYAVFGQLAAADLISGVNILREDNNVNFGDEVLEAEIPGAGYRVGFVAGAFPTGASAEVSGAINTWRTGHYVAVSGNPAANISAAAGGEPALTPTRALQIDTKMDDGRPLTGSVRGGGNAGACVTGTAPDIDYNGSLAAADCVVFVRIQS